MISLTDSKKKKITRLAVLLFFIVVLVVGIVIHSDYGVSVDEPFQRRHSLVNYQYINKVVLNRTIPYLEDMNNADLPEYAAKQYGVALQLPMVLIEDINHFEMTDFEIYQMRHMYNFLIYFCGLVALFFLIKELLRSELVALASTAMFYLFPHFFASSYYNVKDLLFVPMFILSCFFMMRMFTRDRKLVYCLLFALFTALAANIRILGIMTVPAAMVCMLAEDVVRRYAKTPALKAVLPDYRSKGIVKRLLPYFVVAIATFGLMLVIAPASWADPAGYLKLVVGRALDYEVWTRTMVFMGQSLQWDGIPWYYLPVWMGITIPVFTLAMFFVGVSFLVVSVVRKGRFTAFIRNRYIWVFFLFFLLPFLFQILGSIKIYLGWRHMYMLMVPITVLAGYGIQQLHAKLAAKNKPVLTWLVPVATSAALLIAGVRVAINHPYQYSLFNAFGIAQGSQFDRDYYRMSAKQMLEYILEQKPEGKVTVKSNYPLTSPKRGIPTELADRITLRNSNVPAEYYIELFRDYAGNEPNVPGYTEIYSLWQDGYKLDSILLNDFIYNYRHTGVMKIPVNYFFSNSENIYAPQYRNVRSSKGIPDYLLFGPYLQFEAGKYTVQLDLALKSYLPENEFVANVEIAGKEGNVVYASQVVNVSDFKNGKLRLTLPYTLPEEVYDLEVRVFTGSGVWMQVADDVVITHLG